MTPAEIELARIHMRYCRSVWLGYFRDRRIFEARTLPAGDPADARYHADILVPREREAKLIYAKALNALCCARAVAS